MHVLGFLVKHPPLFRNLQKEVKSLHKHIIEVECYQDYSYMTRIVKMSDLM